LLLNTSFNVADRPIVETPTQALECLLSTEIDLLSIDTFMVSRVNT